MEVAEGCEDEGIEIEEEMHGNETEELVCTPCDPVSSEGDGVEAEVEQEAEVQHAATDPGQPTQAEIDDHVVAQPVQAMVLGLCARPGQGRPEPQSQGSLCRARAPSSPDGLLLFDRRG